VLWLYFVAVTAIVVLLTPTDSDTDRDTDRIVVVDLGPIYRLLRLHAIRRGLKWW